MPDYIPPRDTEFSFWADGFRRALDSHGPTFDFSPAEVTALDNLFSAWEAAFSNHQESRSTARAARQVKMSARRTLTELARGYARRLQAHPGITDALRAEFGITLPGAGGVPNPGVIPTTRPLVSVDTAERLRHLVSWTDESTPTSRRRPLGVRSAEIWIKIGGEPPVDASQLIFLATQTRSRHEALFGGDQANTPVHYMLRWVSSRGKPGPWSQTITATVVG